MAENKTRAAAKGEAPSSEKLEELLSKAESCVEEIGKEGQSLEDAFSNYEEGIRLIRQCSRIIDGIEKQMKVLQEEDLQPECSGQSGESEEK
jgi:exodeoxyribonuclease VII small subunit